MGFVIVENRINRFISSVQKVGLPSNESLRICGNNEPDKVCL